MSLGILLTRSRICSFRSFSTSWSQVLIARDSWRSCTMDKANVQSSTRRAMTYLIRALRYVDVGSLIKTQSCSRSSGSGSGRGLLFYASVLASAETISLRPLLQAFPLVHRSGILHHLLFIAPIPHTPVFSTEVLPFLLYP